MTLRKVVLPQGAVRAQLAAQVSAERAAGTPVDQIARKHQFSTAFVYTLLREHRGTK